MSMILMTKGSIDGVTCEECRGRIPDKYRTDNFGPTTLLELPDAKMGDEEFCDWLDRYRKADCWLGDKMLGDSRCD